MTFASVLKRMFVGPEKKIYLPPQLFLFRFANVEETL
jgi:hypothetical protein